MLGEIIFGTPLVLVACLAAAIPVVLHLLGRARAVRLDYAAIRFVRAAAMRTARRRRIENLLLLLLRVGLFGMLPLALALPFYRSSDLTQGGSGGLAIGIVFDTTGSMGQRTDGETVFDRGRLWAQRLIRGVEGFEAPREVVLGTTAGPLQGEPLVSTDIAKVQDAVRKLQPTSAEGKLRPAVQHVAERLQKSSAANKIIYVLSDFQRNTFDLGGEPAAQRLPVVLIELGAKGEDNLGIELAQVAHPPIEGEDALLRVKITGRLTTPRALAVKIETDDGRTPAKQNLYLDRGEIGSKEVELAFPQTKAGWFRGRVELETQDSLAEDNRWFLAWPVARRIRAVLVTEGSKVRDWEDDPALFLRAALQSAGWIETREVPVGQLGQLDLKDVQSVFLAEISELPDAAAKNLDAFLKEHAKAVVAFLPATAISSNYKDWLGRHQLSGLEKAVKADRPVTVSQALTSDPLLGSLQFRTTYYSRIGVSEYWRMDPPPAVRRLLLLAGDEPLLVRAGEGSSVIYLFTTPARTATGTLPLSPIFPALVTQVPSQARESELPRVARAGTAVKFDRSTLAAAGKIVDASGKRAVGLTEQSGQIVLEQAGLYEVLDKKDAPLQTLAVNPSDRVIELARVAAADLEKAAAPTYYVGQPDADLPKLMTELAQGKPIWDYLLTIVLVVMLGETLVANVSLPTSEKKPAAWDQPAESGEASS